MGEIRKLQRSVDCIGQAERDNKRLIYHLQDEQRKVENRLRLTLRDFQREEERRIEASVAKAVDRPGVVRYSAGSLQVNKGGGQAQGESEGGEKTQRMNGGMSDKRVIEGRVGGDGSNDNERVVKSPDDDILHEEGLHEEEGRGGNCRSDHPSSDGEMYLRSIQMEEESSSQKRHKQPKEPAQSRQKAESILTRSSIVHHGELEKKIRWAERGDRLRSTPLSDPKANRMATEDPPDRRRARQHSPLLER
jgi:hypothetical protein